MPLSVHLNLERKLSEMLGEVLRIKQVGGALAAHRAPTQNIIVVADGAAAGGASHLGETHTTQWTSFAQTL